MKSVLKVGLLLEKGTAGVWEQLRLLSQRDGLVIGEGIRSLRLLDCSGGPGVQGDLNLLLLPIA